MSGTFTAFDVNSQLWVRTMLTQELGEGVRVGVRTPDNLANVLPYVNALVLGGPTDGIVLVRPSVSVQAFAADLDGAHELALAAGRAIFNFRGRVLDDVVLVRASGTVPAEEPYDNPNVRRVVATYQLWLKRA